MTYTIAPDGTITMDGQVVARIDAALPPSLFEIIRADMDARLERDADEYEAGMESAREEGYDEGYREGYRDGAEDARHGAL